MEKTSEEITIPHCFIEHESKNKWHVVEPYVGLKIRSIQKTYEVPPTSKYPTHCIRVYYTNGNYYVMGYFNSEESRDVAFSVLKDATLKSRIQLDYETFFKPIKLTRKRIAQYTKKYTVKRLIDIHIDNTFNLKRKELVWDVFISEYNLEAEQKITKIQLKELKDNILPPELDKNSLIADLIRVLTVPKEVRKIPIQWHFFVSVVVSKLHV